MKKIVLLLFLTFVFFNGQAVNIDSLVNVLNTKEMTEDEKIDICWEIGRFCVNNYYDKCIEYSNIGLSLSKKTDNRRRIATFSNLLGISYYYKNSFDTSYVYLNNYLEEAIKIDDKELIAGAYGGLGTLYRLQDDFTTAADFFMKALEVSDTITMFRALILNDLGVIHRTLNHLEHAEAYLNEALEVAHKLNSEYAEMVAYHALGTVYNDKNDADKAIEFCEKSLEISRKLHNTGYELLSAQSLAVNYCGKKEYELALKYASRTLQIAEESNATWHLLQSWHTLAEIYRMLGRYKDCDEMASKAWAVDSTSINEGGFAALNLAIANIYLGNKQKAEKFIAKYQAIMQKGNDKQMTESLANMEVKYETEKKAMRIAALEKDKKLYLALGAVVVFALLSAIGLLIYRHRSTLQKRQIAEQKVKQLEQEKELVAKDAALKAEKTERDLIARDLHDNVGTLLTVVKNNMKLYSDTARKEKEYFDKAFDVLEKSITDLRRVVYHVKSFVLNSEGLTAALEEFCRFIPNVEFQFNGYDHRFDSDKEYALYNCACELINNALKHAKASRIDVLLNMDEKTVYLSVMDNGCGFDPQTVAPGIGMDNIRSYLLVFDGRLDIFSKPGKGTEINIEMDM